MLEILLHEAGYKVHFFSNPIMLSVLLGMQNFQNAKGAISPKIARAINSSPKKTLKRLATFKQFLSSNIQNGS